MSDVVVLVIDDRDRGVPRFSTEVAVIYRTLHVNIIKIIELFFLPRISVDASREIVVSGDNRPDTLPLIKILNKRDTLCRGKILSLLYRCSYRRNIAVSSSNGGVSFARLPPISSSVQSSPLSPGPRALLRGDKARRILSRGPVARLAPSANWSG